MTASEISAYVLQLLLPLALIARVGIVGERTKLSWGIDLALAVSYLAAIALAAPWLPLPWQLPWILGALLAAAALPGGRRAGSDVGDSRSRWQQLGLGLRGLLIVALVTVTALALSGRQEFDRPAMDLTSPLRNGPYLIANGGSGELINPHLKTLEGERFRSYRGQSYALDIVKVGVWGSRSAGPSRDDPSGFAIYGDTLHAPCSGEVVRAVDGMPDRLPAGEEPRTLEGNHVILACDGRWVVLAHVQRGSVAVAEGEQVQVGQPLGLVGNSGRSDEPHLHIHAQTPGTESAPLGGKPVPITIDGQHLARNDRLGGS